MSMSYNVFDEQHDEDHENEIDIRKSSKQEEDDDDMDIDMRDAENKKEKSASASVEELLDHVNELPMEQEFDIPESSNKSKSISQSMAKSVSLDANDKESSDELVSTLHSNEHGKIS